MTRVSWQPPSALLRRTRLRLHLPSPTCLCIPQSPRVRLLTSLAATPLDTSLPVGDRTPRVYAVETLPGLYFIRNPFSDDEQLGTIASI